MKLQVMEVTPEMAKGWLKMNTLNRPVRNRYVESLADMMKRGEWTVNHQAVALNGAKLIDGQHRLLAVIESGLPAVKMAVIKDADTGSFDTIDIGVKRSHADIFREDVAVMLPISFIARLIYGGHATTPRNTKPIYEKLHKPMREIVDLFPRTTKKLGASSIRAGALAAILNGETKKYVYGTYKAMAEFDAKNLSPVAASFLKQLTMGHISPTTGSKQSDLLVRAFTVFSEENRDLERCLVKKVSDRLAKIRDIYRKELNIK